MAQNPITAHNKKLSSELEQKIETANKRWGKAKDSVLEVYNQALRDGWTKVEAAKICREKLTIFSPRTLQRILPDEAKNQAMKRAGGYKQIADNCPQTTIRQHDQELQRSYPYPCLKCDKEAVITETEHLPDNGVRVKAVHVDKSIEDHTWEAYDLLGEINNNTDKDTTTKPEKPKKKSSSDTSIANVEIEAVNTYGTELHDTDTKITNNVMFLLESLTYIDMAEAEKMPLKELLEKSDDHMSQMIKRWTLEQAEITLKASYPLTALLRKFNELLETELANKRRNREMLSA